MIKNYLNYIGSKDRYLPQIMKFIEIGASITGGSGFIDLMCGSAVVGLNAAKHFKQVWCYDVVPEISILHNWVKSAKNSEELLQQVDSLIEKYELSKTNKDGFLRLREDYNTIVSEHGVSVLSEHAASLYCLITHAYNYSLHLNKKHGFNAPSGAGRSYFNNNLRQKLINWKEELDKQSHVNFFCEDFRSSYVTCNLPFLTNVKRGVFFVDPPYSASQSKHPYRVGTARWGDDEDRALLKFLDDISTAGHLFIFTNVIKNNGVTNTILENWVNDNEYISTPVQIDYKNCSYQRRNGGDTQEVIITNFKNIL